MIPIGLERGYFSVAGKIGIKSFVGVKRDNGYFPCLEDSSCTTKKSAFGGGEMSFRSLCPADNGVGAPGFGNHKVVVEY
ncbi:hypothetical protein SDC9_156839 [bioreactor metagenome]|uniref:Uncharacterized protein n=1 Tax=bioreactor metagenome TaxID=1076179 RepID=A0A645F5B2_9ZZZZ